MSDRNSSKKRANGRGKRYSPAEKEKIVRLSERIGVEAAAKRSGVSSWSIYRWRGNQKLAESQATPEAGGNSVGSVRPTRIQIPEATKRRVVSVYAPRDSKRRRRRGSD